MTKLNLRNAAQCIAASGFLFFLSGLAAAAPVVVNGDFETGSAGGYNGIPSWTSVGPYTGLSVRSTTNGSTPFWDNGGTTNVAGVNGAMVGIVEVYRPNNVLTSSISQTVSGFDPLQSYTLNYLENARAFTNDNPLLEVFVGGTSVVAQHVVVPVGGTNPFASVTSSSFQVPSGSASIEFRVTVASAGSDSMPLLDNVTITAVPEPATAGGIIALASAAGLLRTRRRRH